MSAALKEMSIEEESEKKPNKDILFKRLAKHYLSDEIKKENKSAEVTATAYNKDTKILVTGILNIVSFHLAHETNCRVFSRSFLYL